MMTNYIVGLPDIEPRPDQFVALDVETFGQPDNKIHRPTGTFACLSIAFGDRCWQIYDQHDVAEALRRVSAGTWVFHNALYDLTQLRRFAKIEPRFVWDTMVFEQSVWGGYYTLFGLDHLVRRYLKQEMEKSVRDQFSTTIEMTPAMKTYAAQDAIATLAIAEMQQEEHAEFDYAKAYVEIDEPMIWAVLDMQPVKVDVVAWLKLAEENKRTGERIQDELGVNVKSWQQVLKRAGELGIDLPNTRKQTLLDHQEEPFIAAVIEGRMYRDAYSRYGKRWIKNAIEEGDLVFPSWKINGASTTGRMSCSDPNLQQIPVRNMPIFRDMFISKYAGGKVIVSDVSQQEPRILAFISGDENLRNAFIRDEDIHLFVTRKIYKDESITKDDPRRRHGKDINLGLSYGLTPQGLEARTGLTLMEAEGLIREYFRSFPGVQRYISQYRNKAVRLEMVKTAQGRRCWVNPYNSSGMNNAINSPVQGSAAQHTKSAAVTLWRECRREGLPYPVWGLIHDEIAEDSPAELVSTYSKMTDEAWLSVAESMFSGIPFKVDTVSGNNWGVKT